MPAGRPLKPTAQKKYEGNPGRRELVADDFQPDGVPVKPEGLNKDASWLWDLVVDPLIAQRIATSVDTPLLIGVCCWWSLYATLQRTIDDDIPDYRTVCMASMAWKAFTLGASKCGLTPSDRAGLKTTANGSHSPLEQFIKPYVPCRTN